MTGALKDQLRILLINAIDPNSEVESRYPNLGLGYLAASVRRALPDIDTRFVVADSNILSVLQSFRPHLAGITTVSQNFHIAQIYMELLAEHSVPTVWGGVHISALPHLLPSEAAVACIGEGEETFVDVVKSFLAGRMTPANLYSISGVAFWDKGELQITHAPKPIADLDTLPMPARDLLTIRPDTYMFTSRGCPYKCTFCSSARYWGKTRFFSAEYVVEEIEYLQRIFNVNMIRFFDDLFIAKRSRLEEIIRLMERRNLLGKINFTCNSRANLIDDEIAKLLSRLGMVSTGFGLESGDEETLRYLKCGSVSVEHNHKAVKIIKKAGIAVNASFVIGSPNETRSSIIKTYDFIRKSELDWFEIYILTPFPGTPVWDYAKQRGIVNDNNFDWSSLNVNVYRNPDKAIILSETLSKQEIIKLYKKFKRLRLSRGLLKAWNNPLRRQIPRYIWTRILEFLTDKLGKKRITLDHLYKKGVK